MPTERRDAATKTKLKALREAARLGIADIEAGRYRSFETPEALTDYLAAEADAALAE